MSSFYYKTSDTITPIFEIRPLESNGPGAQSTPRRIVDVEFLDKSFAIPTDAFIIQDDVTTTFVQGFVFDVIGDGLYVGTYTVNVAGYFPGDVVAQLDLSGKTHIPVADIVSPSVPVPYGFVPSSSVVVTATTPGNYLVKWEIAGEPIISANDLIQVKRIFYNDNVTNGVIDRTYVVQSVSPGPFAGQTTVYTVLTDEQAGSMLPTIGVNSDSAFVTPAPTSTEYGYVQYTVVPTATSLMLVGKGAPLFNNTTSWGTAMQSNLIHMMEHFADTTAPVSPMNGQMWFDTNSYGPAMQVQYNGSWYGVVAESLPVQGNINLNDFKIAKVANATTTYPYVASSTGWGNNDQEVMNLGTSDSVYIAKTGGYNADPTVRSGTMTGSLNMTGTAGLNFKVGSSGNLIFESTSSGSITIAGTGSITVDTGNIVATTGNVRVGSGTNQVVVQNNTGAAPTIVFTTSVVGNDVIDLNDNMLTGLSNAVNPTDAVSLQFADARYVNLTGDTMTGALILNADPTAALGAATKQYVDMFVSGIIWLSPTLDQSLFNDTLSTPPTDDGLLAYHKAFIVAGTGTGAWTGFDGHLMYYDGTNWLSILGRPVAIGDRFGVFMEPDNDDPLVNLPGGGLTGQMGKIATVTGISPYTYTFYTPAEPDAFTVVGVDIVGAAQSAHMGHSYTFRGTYGVGTYGTDYEWIEFLVPQTLIDGAGLAYAGQTLNVDGNLLSLYNLSTNGIIARTAANTVTARTITGTASNIVVSNGDGVANNPTIDLATVTQGAVGTSFVKVALDGYGRVTNNTAVVASDITGLVDGTYVNVTGDTMTGDLTLNANPTLALHAAPKQYVDVARVMALAASVNGTVPTSAKVLMAITAQAFNIDATPATNPCYGYADVASAGSAVFDILKNGLIVGSMTFSAGVNAATFTFGSLVSFVPGDRIVVVAPATPDATLADVYFTLRGTLV